MSRELQRPRLYICDADGEPVPLKDCEILRWAQWMGSDPEHGIVQQDKVEGVLVSTVFLGLDHNWSGTGKPVLWETMVFGHGKRYRNDLLQERYTSRAAALAGHCEVLKAVKAGKLHGSAN